MKRLLVILACAVGAAWAGERPIVSADETKGLVPIGSIPCVPLYEVKSVRMTVCRVPGSEVQRVVTTATVAQNKTDNCDLIVTINLPQFLHATQGNQSVRVPQTKKGEQVTVRFIASLARNIPLESLKAKKDSQPRGVAFTFETASPEPPK